MSWDGTRALKACPERCEGRRLGEDASPEGSPVSFRTDEVSKAWSGLNVKASLEITCFELR